MTKALGLQCVRCNSVSLAITDKDIWCYGCGAYYPIIHDLPIMFADVVVKSTKRRASIELATQMGSAFTLPCDKLTLALIQDIFSKDYKFADLLIDVESRQFLDRVRNSGIQLSDRSITEDKSKSKPNNKDTHPVNVAKLTRYRWLLDYLPRQIQVAKTLTGNVRLENVGISTLSSHIHPPIFISYHWRSPEGALVIQEGHRTPLPIDLLPGRQLTVPMLLQAPKHPGRYLLEIMLVNEGVCWLDDGAKTIPIEIVANTPPDLTSKWHLTQQSAESYVADHQRGVELLQERLKKLGKPQPKILEVGGNAHPMIQVLAGELYNVDVDVHGLQIGFLATQRSGVKMKFLCADANALPFVDHFFDCIVIFSSLHHFPNLPATLRALARKVQPDGFIAVLCEPSGHYFGDNIPPDFHEELLKGVNEQTFSLSEYAEIFRYAGLEAEEVTVDAGSLKAFLTLPQSCAPDTYRDILA